MNTVIISATINEKKRAEFFQTTESLQSLINKYCSDLKISVDSRNNVAISISFEGNKQLENYYSKDEFKIFKGTLRSLCDNVEIKTELS